MLKAICLGRVNYEISLIVDKMPQPGTTTEFFEKKGDIGGSAAIMSYCLAKWGIGTAFAGVIGNDVNGTRVKKRLEDVHIDTRYLEPSYDNDTSISTVLIDKSTLSNTVFNMSDKYVGLKKCDFDFSPDIIVIDGYDVVQDKVLLERFPKCLSVLDASIITSSVADLLRKVKYAVCSLEFAESLVGIKADFQEPSTLVAIFQRMQKKYLNTSFVVTLGQKGAMYSINNQIKISPSLKVDSVDTNGTGPIFRAAFAYTIVNGGDLEKAVKMGCIAAGLSTTKYGSAVSVPTLEEIKNIYEQNY